MVRIDMSEYMEKHSVSRLLGAPPGYIGFEEGGQLTEAVRRKPYCVLLLDEVEKAHPDVFNILLQMLDDGRLTDSHGRTLNFQNTIIIMTSNIGSEYLFEGIDVHGQISTASREQVMTALHQHFRPEFLNRVDDTVLFRPLSEDDISRIVELFMAELHGRLEKQHVQMEITAAARCWFAREGYDPVFGARPLKRFIQQHVESPVARLLIAGDAMPGSRMVIDIEDEKLSLRVEAP